MKIQIKIDGLEEMKSALNKAPELVVNESSKAINKSILTIQSNASKEAPANKEIGQGVRLKGSFRTQMISKLSGMVYSISSYALFVHDGTKPHIIRVKNKKVLANARSGQFFGEIVHHPGTKPNQFFWRAIERSKDSIESFFQSALDNVLKVFPK
jgi:hypothetical protein